MSNVIPTFGRSEFARILDAPLPTVNSYITRDLIPTLVGKRKRPALTGFDAWLAVSADMFCREGGLDRTVVSRAMSMQLNSLLEYARRIDVGEQNLAAIIVTRADGKSGCLCRPLAENVLKGLVGPIIRTAFISLNVAADLVRTNAQEQGVDIGDRIGLTADEWTNLNPLKRGRSDAKNERQASQRHD
jgi:hypothetical protein